MTLRHLLDELKRRHVPRVVGAYAVAAWAAVEVTSTVFPLLGLPQWAATAVVVLALLGFPVTLALAWIFDITPQGVRRTALTAAPSGDVATADLPPASAAPAAAGPPPADAGGARRSLGFFGFGILVALVAFAAYARLRPGAEEPASAGGIRSTAVLPFIDLSARHDQEYFSDGITEELLNRLAQVDGLRVAARTSSFAFKGKNEDISEIGRQLRVEGVLEGSMRVDGDRVRITAQLVDARTGYHLWSRDFDRTRQGVLEVQDEIAGAIVGALRMQFAGGTAMDAAVAAGEPVGTRDVRAHDLYLLGLARWHERTNANLRLALDAFQQAVAIDSSYALAWAGIAQTYAVLPAYGGFPVGEAVARGTAAAARALALNAGVAEAHAALGQIAQNLEWDLPSAEEDYRRAVAFKPAYATAHQWYGETLLMLGRLDEADAEFRHALELDPLSPFALAGRAYELDLRGQLEAARAANAALSERNPDFAVGQLLALFFDLQTHRWEDAGAAAAHAFRDDTTAAAAAATIIDGVRDPGRRAAGVAARSDANFAFLLVHPLLAPLRTDPRFRAIADSVGVSFASSS